VYCPYLISFFVGPLTECDHCIGLYLTYFLALPTWSFVALPLQFGTTGIVVGSIASLASVALLTLIQRRTKKWIAWSVGIFVAGAGCISSLAFSALIRA